jgi:hypothetical protein
MADIGSVWAAGSWSSSAWAANTWADASTVATGGMIPAWANGAWAGSANQTITGSQSNRWFWANGAVVKPVTGGFPAYPRERIKRGRGR